MLRQFLLAGLIWALLGIPTIATAQSSPEDLALDRSDLPEGFVLSSAERSQQLGTDFYAAIYRRAPAGLGDTDSGPWLVASIVGVGGSGDLNLAMAFFLSRFPASPTRPELPTMVGPPIGDAWNWLGFDSTLDGDPMTAYAVAFRVRDRVAVVAAAGPEIAVEETVALAHVIEGRLAGEL